MSKIDKDLEDLKWQVVNGKNEIFLVNSIETSRGKTTGTAAAIANYFDNYEEKLFSADSRFVFVSKFAEECAKIAKSINEKVQADDLKRLREVYEDLVLFWGLDEELIDEFGEKVGVLKE